MLSINEGNLLYAISRLREIVYYLEVNLRTVAGWRRCHATFTFLALSCEGWDAQGQILKGGRRVARLTTLPARQKDSAHWRKPQKKEGRVKSVGLNDGDKNSENAKAGEGRKRDSKREAEKREKWRRQEKEREK